MKHNIQVYKLPTGQWLCILAEGRLVNLAAGDGHPAVIMGKKIDTLTEETVYHSRYIFDLPQAPLSIQVLF